MPKVAELREIDGAIWARIEIDAKDGVVELLSAKEIEERRNQLANLLDQIAGLRRTLWMIVRDNNGYVLSREAQEAYPGDDRAWLNSATDESTGITTFKTTLGPQ